MPNYIKTDNICELTSDHTTVLLIMNTRVFKKSRKQNLINRHNDWNKFGEVLDNFTNNAQNLR